MNYTYLAVLSTDNYLTGALVLHETLKRTKVNFPLTVLVTKNVSRSSEKALIQKGISVIRKNENITLDSKQQKQNEDAGYKYWNYTFDSLYAFELTQFDKIVYLDCDIIPLVNLDHLFEKPHLSALLDPGTKDLSSGIMVIEPKEGELAKLMSVIPEVIRNKFYFGDQNIIQACYKEWPNQHEKHLADIYNAYVEYLNYFVNSGYTFQGNGNNIAVVHFPGSKKPWMCTKEEIKQLKQKFLQNNNPYGAQMLDYYQELINIL